MGLAKRLYSTLIGIVALGLIALSYTPVFAASTATIRASAPKTALSVNETVTVTVAIEGGGSNFTSFGATVSVSNLTIVSLTKHSSVVQWTREPSPSSPSFFGAVAGSVANATVYQMDVKATTAGSASVAISDGTVKSTDGYTVQEIIKDQVGVSFTVSGGSDGGGNQPTSNETTSNGGSTSDNRTTTTTQTPTVRWWFRSTCLHDPTQCCQWCCP